MKLALRFQESMPMMLFLGDFEYLIHVLTFQFMPQNPSFHGFVFTNDTNFVCEYDTEINDATDYSSNCDVSKYGSLAVSHTVRGLLRHRIKFRITFRL